MTPDDHALAGELALGVLEGADRAAALERLLAEPDFAAEVAWWRQHLDELTADYASVDAPSATPDVPATDDAGGAVAAARPWRWAVGGGAAGALAAAAAIALLVLPRAAPPAPPAPIVRHSPPLVAVLVPSEGERRDPIAAVLDRDTGTLRLTATITVPREKVAELWRIGGDKTPRPLGLLPAGARTVATRTNGTAPAPTETLAISIEPQGGSPTGLPTGPVIAAGTVVVS